VDQISNVQTAADYTDALTLGPSNYDAISVNVWNNSCISQTFELGPGGDYQTGQWGAESLEAANSTFQLGNCGGVRFKTNPDTPGSVARIVAYAWKSGDVQKLGGIQLSGTISGTGAVMPTLGIMTGIVDCVAGTVIAGTGFTVVKNAAGDFTINYNTSFAATPATNVTPQVTAQKVWPDIVTPTASAFRVFLYNAAGTLTDPDRFHFTCTPIS